MNISRIPGLFDNEVGDESYVACRNHAYKQESRAALENAWAKYGQLCPEDPEHFVREFGLHFHARAWELFLIAVLSDAGLAIERAPTPGPDICLRLPTGVKCWIEAVVPTSGAGVDAVIQRTPGRSWTGAIGPKSKLLLRYRSVLEDKRKKVESYKAQGIVATEDAVLIAVYQGGISDSDLHDDDLPAIVRAVLPFGETLLRVPLYSDEPHETIVPRREAVTKANGNEVSTTFFEERETQFISGILFARQAVWNLPWRADKALSLIHRPGTFVPVPRSSIPTRCELWVENNILEHRGRCAQFGPYARESE